MAEEIGSRTIIQFGIFSTVTQMHGLLDSIFGKPTKDVGLFYGGAATLTASTSTTGCIQVVVDPDDLRSGRSDAPLPTAGEAVAHELLGHALGLLRHPTALVPNTNRMAVEAENAARRRNGVARGQRSGHFGGFPVPQYPWWR